MPAEDLKNNQAIRKVLVRHWIDLGRIAVNSINGRANIRGTMQLLRGVKHNLDSQMMENIFREINRIKDIKRLSIELDNWFFDEGSWKKSERKTRDQHSFNEDNNASYEL